jgi:hypothetical protein
MVRKVHNDGCLRGRAPRRYLEAARMIGGGDMSRGLRIAIMEAAQRRGIRLGEGTVSAGRRRDEVTMIVSALYHGGSQVLRAMEALKFPSYAHEIAGKAGLEKDVATRCLEELSALDLVEERLPSNKSPARETIYCLTDPGKYITYVLVTLDQELPLVRGEEGMKKITAFHVSLVKRLSAKHSDIKEAVEKINNTADLMKSNTEALLRLIT